MSRERPADPIIAIDDSPSTLSSAQVLETLQLARNSEGEGRLRLAGVLNDLLRRGPSEGDREAFAQQIIEKLDDEAFHELYDAEGISCRAVAVEALLALGFPHALNLWPDDLEYYRALKPSNTGSPTLRAMAVVTGVLAALFALAFFIHF
jgi:hypothetical protein